MRVEVDDHPASLMARLRLVNLGGNKRRRNRQDAKDAKDHAKARSAIQAKGPGYDSMYPGPFELFNPYSLCAFFAPLASLYFRLLARSWRSWRLGGFVSLRLK
jgi:hypothetical protein